MKELPEKYYLSHFLEFTDYIHSTSSHLLSDTEHQFLSDFAVLPEDAQCLLVRIINRKSAFFREDKLIYDEIDDVAAAIDILQNMHFISRINKQNYSELLTHLNKQELMALASYCEHNKPIKSATKHTWFSFVLHHQTNELAYQIVKKHPMLTRYIYFSKQHTLHYLLFLYFGHLGGRLNQFSLRDLGVMQTQNTTQQRANFIHLDEAKSAFLHANVFREIKTCDKSQVPETKVLAHALLKQETPIGTLANEKYNHSLYTLGAALIDIDMPLAVSLLSRSLHPAAQEKYIRLLYKTGQKETCKQLLTDIIDDPTCESLLLFAEDFYALKFDKKRTSLLTDILRQSDTSLTLDEAYLGQVESGVKAHYIANGYDCYFTENKLWRALFGLTFWHELYTHPESHKANEFTYFPTQLRNNTFFNQFEQHIHNKLSQFELDDTFSAFISEQIARYQGMPNGLFFWHDKLQDVVSQFIAHVPIQLITAHLSAMAQNFSELADGYPDLMLIKDKQVHFKEVKAPGDSLRRNQLVSIKQLIKVGFNVSIQRVKWQFNQHQRYVVVDIETTGGKKGNHRITEIGMVCIENARVIESWQTLVNPERHIPKMITKLTGIDNDMVKNAPVFADIADQLDAFCQNAIFVAHNVNFDYGFIKQEFARLNRHFARAKICTVQQARKYLPGFSSYSLGKLCKSLDIPLENHHRALDDAKAAAEVLLRINQVRAEQQDKGEQ